MTDAFAEDNRHMAPTFEQIEAIETREAVQSELTRAEDSCLSIETQLEFFPSGDDSHRIRGRRVTALIYWRIARKNLKKRLAEISK